MKIFLIISAVIAVSACATPGARMNGQFIFKDEISDIRESVGRGNLPQAVQNLSMLLEMDPKNKEARSLRAVAYQKLGQFENAIADYTLLISKYPDDAQANYNLGMIYAFKLIDKSAALTYFDRFLTLDMNSSKAFDVAKIMCSLDGSVRPLKAKGPEVFSKWSYNKALDEKDDKARRNLLLDSVALDPSQKDAYLVLAGEMESKRDARTAIEYYKKAIDASPTFSEAHFRLGHLLLEENRVEEASVHLAKASLFSPNDERFRR